MITGEERLCEGLGDVYGRVVSYESRPSQTQVDRSDALARFHETNCFARLPVTGL